MRDFQRMLLSTEVRELSDEISRLFEDLDRTVPDRRLTPGTCSPLLDVVETDDAIEIVVDLAGVPPNAIRVLLKNGVALIVGDKPRPDPLDRDDATFHLVERGCGGFARAVRLSGAVDAGRARAHLRSGELRIVVPKIPERRGQDIAVPIEDHHDRPPAEPR